MTVRVGGLGVARWGWPWVAAGWRSTRLVGILALAGGAFGAVVLVLTASDRHETSTTTLFSGAVGGLYLTAGMVAQVRQPDNRVGLLMVLVGSGWFAEDLQISIDPLVHTVGLLVRSASTGFLVHLLLAFPGGRLRSRFERIPVVATYVVVFGLIPATTPFFRSVTPNLLLDLLLYNIC